jgi:uncharacterized membrane protein YesL
MDRETAVIRAEMSQTRAELDRKIARLEDRAREMTPRRYWNRHKPEYLADQVIGAVLTIVGISLALNQLRSHRRQRKHLRSALASYEAW